MSKIMKDTTKDYNKSLRKVGLDKSKVIEFLYNDWLDYKNFYQQEMDFKMQETFLEYLYREIPEYENSDGSYGG